MSASEIYVATGEALSILGDKEAAMDRFSNALTMLPADRLNVRLAVAQEMAKAGHVEDAERPREGRQHKSVEPMEQRPRGHKPAVCPGYVAEAASQLVPAARLVHSLGKLRAMAKIRRFKLHGRAWSQR